jgi:hypothetical protein
VRTLTESAQINAYRLATLRAHRHTPGWLDRSMLHRVISMSVVGSSAAHCQQWQAQADLGGRAVQGRPVGHRPGDVG